MHPDLEALLVLQECDQAVRAADAALAALDPEMRALDDAAQAGERALERARRGVDDAVGRREDLEKRIANHRVMQDQRRQKLEWVRGAKEASSIMAELDLTRSVLVKDEADYMRSGDAVTAAELGAAEAESALEDLRAAQAPLREALGARRDALVAERERAASDRRQQAAQVQADLLVRYERIRRGKAPFALYPLHADACGHCFTAVPTQRRALILRGTAIDGCEACGVLLYAVS